LFCNAFGDILFCGIHVTFMRRTLWFWLFPILSFSAIWIWYFLTIDTWFPLFLSIYDLSFATLPYVLLELACPTRNDEVARSKAIRSMNFYRYVFLLDWIFSKNFPLCSLEKLWCLGQKAYTLYVTFPVWQKCSTLDLKFCDVLGLGWRFLLVLNMILLGLAV
jgi:hypothetical protein